MEGKWLASENCVVLWWVGERTPSLLVRLMMLLLLLLVVLVVLVSPPPLDQCKLFQWPQPL